MKASVLLNVAAGSVESGGTAGDIARIAEAFRSAGAAAERAASCDADAVVMGGGDGTLSCAVKALVGGDKPLGILPLGTLNHFARDLGVPSGLDGAVRTVVAGHVRCVDVGEVNGHLFLNNSSLGIYPEVVRERDEIHERGAGSRWPA